MKKKFKNLAFVFSFISFACNAQEQREEWINKSSAIFKAEVLLLHTSTVNWSEPGDLGVVRLLEIFDGEKQLSAFLKDQITVKFQNIDKVRKGQVIIVYGNVWLTNESIAVTEIAHEVIGENNLTPDNYKEEMKKSQQRATMQKIKNKAAKSELVISGTVLGIKKMQVDYPAESEHNPEWVLAEIKVGESMKGDKGPGSVVTIAFPGSQDVMWFNSPRFKEGSNGIWFLSRENLGFKDVKHFTVTTMDQVRDIKDIELVKQSLR